MDDFPSAFGNVVFGLMVTVPAILGFVYAVTFLFGPFLHGYLGRRGW